MQTNDVTPTGCLQGHAIATVYKRYESVFQHIEAQR